VLTIVFPGRSPASGSGVRPPALGVCARAPVGRLVLEEVSGTGCRDNRKEMRDEMRTVLVCGNAVGDATAGLAESPRDEEVRGGVGYG